MAKLLQVRAFYLPDAQRLVVYGLGEHLTHRFFLQVQDPDPGKVNIGGVERDVTLEKGRRIKLGNTNPPISMFVAVFKIELLVADKADGKGKRDIRGAANLRVTVTNTPTRGKKRDAFLAGNPFKIKASKITESAATGLPRVPQDAIPDD